MNFVRAVVILFDLAALLCALLALTFVADQLREAATAGLPSAAFPLLALSLAVVPYCIAGSIHRIVDLFRPTSGTSAS